MKTVAILTLLTAIHAVESDGGRDPRCGGNEYQITKRCVDDVNRICEKHDFYHRFGYGDVLDPVKSRGIAIIYMSHYGEKYRKRTGKEPTAKVYALIFHLGYKGYFDPAKSAEGERYWRKISRQLNQGTNERRTECRRK